MKALLPTKKIPAFCWTKSGTTSPIPNITSGDISNNHAKKKPINARVNGLTETIFDSIFQHLQKSDREEIPFAGYFLLG